jgi:hypothetical protein
MTEAQSVLRAGGLTNLSFPGASVPREETMAR